MAESVCSPTLVQTLANWTGTMCINYARNMDEVDAYTTSWVASNKSVFAKYEDSATSPLKGWQLDNVYTTGPQVFDSLMIDTVHIVMEAFHNAYVANNSYDFDSGVNTDALIGRIRNTSIPGHTGQLKMDANGERIGSLVELFNVDSSAKPRRIGSWEFGTDVANATLNRTDLFWKGSYSSSESPLQTITEVEEDNQTTIVVAVLISVCVLMIIMAVIYQFNKRNPELVRQMLGTGLIGVVGIAALLIAEAGMAAITVHFAFDLSVISETFRVVYFVAGCITLVVFVFSMFCFLSSFAANLRRDRVTDDAANDLRELAQKASSAGMRDSMAGLLSIVLQHTPIVVLAVVAFIDTFHFTFMIAVVLSSIVVGWKLQAVPSLLQTLRNPKSQSSEVLHNLGIPRQEVSSFMDPDILQRIRIAYRAEHHERIEAVEAVAASCMEYLELEGVEPSEFFAAVLPKLVSAYDRQAVEGGVPDGAPNGTSVLMRQSTNQIIGGASVHPDSVNFGPKTNPLEGSQQPEAGVVASVDQWDVESTTTSSCSSGNATPRQGSIEVNETAEVREATELSVVPEEGSVLAIVPEQS